MIHDPLGGNSKPQASVGIIASAIPMPSKETANGGGQPCMCRWLFQPGEGQVKCCAGHMLTQASPPETMR